MLKKIFLFLIIIFSTSSLFCDNQKKISVQLLWKHQFEFAGFYMAKEKGFYKDVGLDVSFKEYEFGIDISKEVSEQKSDFGVDSSSLILDRINGLDVYLLMPFVQISPFVLMVKQRDDIKSVNDLRDKNIMLTPNQISMASLNAMLKVNNLSNRDFISQEHSFKTQDLIDGKTDAMAVYLSNEPYYLIEKNIKYKIFNPVDYGFNFYDNVLFTSEKLFNANPEVVKDFYEATKKGWEYAYNNIDESVKVILAKYNTQNKSYAHLKYEANELKKMSHFNMDEYGKFRPEIINQIVQTYNLLDISKSSVNINDFIYPEAIYKENNINFILITKILIGGLLILIGFYFWNRKLSNLNKKIQESQKKISILLNNAGQGFLIFKSDFKIDDEYSKECEKILGENLAFKDIRELLFSEKKKKEFFTTTFLNASHEAMQVKRNSYLSLLPNIIILNKKAIKLEYKILDNETFMLILTNVTTQKKLENKIKKEQEIFKMIVAIASDSSVFYDLMFEYEKFISNEIDTNNISELYRVVHTFKGAFSQLYMTEVVKILHSLETILSDISRDNSLNKDSIKDIICNFDFKSSYNETKKIVTEILGEEFLNHNNYIKIDLASILDLQTRISAIIGEKELTNPECQEILSKIKDLSRPTLYGLFKPYISMVSKLASKFEKEINELIIDGDKNLVVDNELKPFIKSLGHLFRNCIDHGIERPDIRIGKNKEEKGTIMCQFKQINNKLLITIADDGMGIDLEEIKQKAIEKSIDISMFTKTDLMNLIFNDDFSTKDKVSEISGRGVGMSVVKNELDRVNGTLFVSSIKGKGTTFEFSIPFKNL